MWIKCLLISSPEPLFSTTRAGGMCLYILIVVLNVFFLFRPTLPQKSEHSHTPLPLVKNTLSLLTSFPPLSPFAILLGTWPKWLNVFKCDKQCTSLPTLLQYNVSLWLGLWCMIWNLFQYWCYEYVSILCTLQWWLNERWKGGGALFKDAKRFSVTMLQSWAALFIVLDGTKQTTEDRFSSISFFFFACE